jgi:drug/metabolite transporter (DMT)-like permease
VITNEINLSVKGIVLTMAAVLAFAANSVLCRLALGDQLIDPASFTALRIVSGCVTLLVVLLIKKLISSQSPLKKQLNLKLKGSFRSWLDSLSLLLYAVCFSFAYNSLNTATGALILFATVQVGLLVVNFLQGKRLNRVEWFGVLITMSGFILLMLPKAESPSLNGSILMMIAGIAWVLYTVAGKKAADPLQMITVSFVRCLPFCILLLLFFFAQWQVTEQGILLAILSGSFASGLGYVIWYQALRHITLTVAALSQLGAPVLAAVGGVFLVGEPMTAILWVSASAIVFGISMVVFGQKQQ